MAKLAYDHKGEWVLELETDGRVFVRQDGGPLYYFGHVDNLEVPTVSAWRARVPAALIASFDEAARSTSHFDSLPIPDVRA